MSQQNDPTDIGKMIGNLKKLCAIIIGATALAMLTSLFKADLLNLKTELKMIILLAASSAVTMITVAFILFGVIVKNTASKSGARSPREGAFRIVRSAWLIRYVFLLSVCFLNFMVGILENNLIGLLIGTAALLLMCVTFPSTSKVENAIQQHLES